MEDGFSLKQSRVCIVGLGLMGGSLAKALRGHVADLTGIDDDPATCRDATAQGLTRQADGKLSSAIEADVVVLATPVRTIIRLIGELGDYLRPGTLLIDLGSVKGPVVRAMNGLPVSVQAIGGHPMCGKAVSGLAHADGALYRGAPFVLCRSDRTTPDAVALARQMVAAIGAQAIEVEAAHHDRVVAVTSGLPYALAAALTLVAGVQAEDDAMIWTLAASGFRDTSRLAGSDPTMMADILQTNAPAVLDALEEAQAHLTTLVSILRSNKSEDLHATLSRAQAYRHAWEKERGNR
jgi:prephenate dehydrogenase